MPAISRVRRKWSIDIGISRLISVGMRAITSSCISKSYALCGSHTTPTSDPCVRLIHRRISPRSTHTCITRIDLTRLLRLTLRSRPPAAWTSHHLLVQALEWRAARVVEAYASLNTKGEIDASADKRVCRPVTEAFVAGQASEMIDALPFRKPIKNHPYPPFSDSDW